MQSIAPALTPSIDIRENPSPNVVTNINTKLSPKTKSIEKEQPDNQTTVTPNCNININSTSSGQSNPISSGDEGNPYDDHDFFVDDPLEYVRNLSAKGYFYGNGRTLATPTKPRTAGRIRYNCSMHRKRVSTNTLCKETLYFVKYRAIRKWGVRHVGTHNHEPLHQRQAPQRLGQSLHTFKEEINRLEHDCTRSAVGEYLSPVFSSGVVSRASAINTATLENLVHGNSHGPKISPRRERAVPILPLVPCIQPPSPIHPPTSMQYKMPIWKENPPSTALQPSIPAKRKRSTVPLPPPKPRPLLKLAPRPERHVSIEGLNSAAIIVSAKDLGSENFTNTSDTSNPSKAVSVDKGGSRRDSKQDVNIIQSTEERPRKESIIETKETGTSAQEHCSPASGSVSAVICVHQTNGAVYPPLSKGSCSKFSPNKLSKIPINSAVEPYSDQPATATERKIKLQLSSHVEDTPHASSSPYPPPTNKCNASLPNAPITKSNVESKASVPPSTSTSPGSVHFSEGDASVLTPTSSVKITSTAPELPLSIPHLPRNDDAPLSPSQTKTHTGIAVTRAVPSKASPALPVTPMAPVLHLSTGKSSSDAHQNVNSSGVSDKMRKTPDVSRNTINTKKNDIRVEIGDGNEEEDEEKDNVGSINDQWNYQDSLSLFNECYQLAQENAGSEWLHDRLNDICDALQSRQLPGMIWNFDVISNSMNRRVEKSHDEDEELRGSRKLKKKRRHLAPFHRTNVRSNDGMKVTRLTN